MKDRLCLLLLTSRAPGRPKPGEAPSGGRLAYPRDGGLS